MDKQKTSRQSNPSGPRRRAAGARPDRISWASVSVCVLLPVLVAIVYSQAASFPFANIDDNEYVSENGHLAGGLSGSGIVWAFTEMHRGGHWHPVTWLSLMLDSELYGIDHPSGYHVTNIILHAVNAVVLFLLLREVTGDKWPSALAAAVFAAHPARVESVVWITERKDVLSGLFGLLALWAYARYARLPSAGRYLAVAAALALGLMAKPMLVTWPLLFLLLDYWPLNRFAGRITLRRLGPLVVEKLPLMLLVAASAAVAVLAQRSAGAIISLQSMPFSARICRAGVLYAGYIRKTLWPANLTIYCGDSPAHFWPALGAGTLLLLLTAAALWGARRGQRWLAVGWLWFLAALLPTIGLVQVGVQVEADRFLYLPQIGLCVAVAWAASHALRRRGSRLRCAGGAAAALVVAGLAACAWQQAAYWRDSIVLWDHALQCAEGDYFVRYTLANALTDHGRMEEAITLYERSLAINPNFADSYDNLGSALATCGRFEAAISSFRTALAINPDLAVAHGNLGVALLRRGRAEDVDEAVEHFRKALDAKRDDPAAHNALGFGLLQARKFDEAISEFQQALEIKPDYVAARQNLDRARAAVP
jgi:tetratricopeptide (TPR) repeat protein